MKRQTQLSRIATGLLVGLSACASAPVMVPPPPDPVPEPASLVAIPVTPPAPAPEDPSFRKTPPPSGPEAPFVAPKIAESRLSNGVRVLVVSRHEMPVVAVSVVVDRGADHQGTPGLASALASMLLSGTKTRSALALSDELDGLGATYNAFGDHDGIGVSAQVLRDKADALVPLLADIVQNPAFASSELDRERKKRLTALAAQADVPSILMNNAVGEKLYPAGHPYRDPLLGTKAALEAMRPGDLARLHGALFRPGQTTVAIAGDIDAAAAVALVEKSFSAWKAAAPEEAKVPKDPPAPAKNEKRVLVVDRPGAAQSNVAVALVGVSRKNPDYEALLVMNTVLGGQFTSRLNLNLREKHAYTYGARSAFDMRHGAGPFSAGGAIMTAATVPAVKEIFAEIERMRREPVPAEELADAKTNLIRQLPARFETAGDTASTLARLSMMGLPLDEPATRPARIAKVTAEDVQRVAEKYLKPELMRVIVVGDAAVVEKDLAAIGMGDVEVRRAAKPEEKKKEQPSAGPKKEASVKKAAASGNDKKKKKDPPGARH